jgi:alkylation response protein AidB-like acyl-CoA dehydrogenase
VALSSAERDELRSTARALLGRSCSTAQVRRTAMDADGVDRELWAQVVELGWTSIHLSEAHGGGGCGFTDLRIILHELGRALAPIPFLASAVVASGALALAEHRELAAPILDALVAGDAVATSVLACDHGSYDRRRASVRWRSEPDGLRLDGAAAFVLDADLADWLVVAVSHEDGTAAAVALERGTAGVRIERMATVDETRRLFRVTFDGAAVGADRLLVAPGDPAQALIDRIVALGAIAAAADASGAAERMLEVSAAYARERQQFGKAIGSFQAVKHHCANMAIDVEASRSAVGAASAALDGDPCGWPAAAAIAASFVGPACSRACGLAMRVHGGIGFTWEHDTHLFLKRVKLDEVLFGTPAWHRRRLADAVFPSIIGAAQP